METKQVNEVINEEYYMKRNVDSQLQYNHLLFKEVVGVGEAINLLHFGGKSMERSLSE
jgi:hypothetical protein